MRQRGEGERGKKEGEGRRGKDGKRGKERAGYGRKSTAEKRRVG